MTCVGRRLNLKTLLNRFFIKHFPTRRAQLNSGEGNHKVTKKKQQKNHSLEDSPAFFLNLRIPANLKKKHSRNQLELTNYVFLLWKRNIPNNTPKSDYITGVTSALLYFKVTGKSDADHFGEILDHFYGIHEFSAPSGPESTRKQH